LKYIESIDNMINIIYYMNDIVINMIVIFMSYYKFNSLIYII